MNADADIIVVGSGHNGLVAAGYLAAAGKRVLVLERNHQPGGGVSSAELTEPGFVSERCGLMHVLILSNPLIADDELGLQGRYGLEYLNLEKPYSAVFEDGSFLPLHRDRPSTMAQIEKFSPRDAEAYDKFMDLAVQIVDLVSPGFSVPPAAALDQAAALGKTPLGREILRAASMSSADLLAEWFEDERVRITLERLTSEIIVAHPEDLNTGIYAYVGLGFIERYGMAMPRGGGSAFTEACIRCIEEHGGEVRTSVEVARILTDSGRAVGVRTTDGEELRASDAVLAMIHPHRLGSMVDGLNPEIARSAALTKLSPYSAVVVHASLDEPLRFKAGPEVDEIPWNTLTPSSLDAMYGSYDDIRRGRLPTVPLLEAGCPSIVDPTRAPDGKAILHMLSITARNLTDGGMERWNTVKDAVADAHLARLSEFTTNFEPGSVRVQEVVSPPDLETWSPSFAGGDYVGIAMYWQQMGSMRPTPELSQYAVPGLLGLYLTGPFMHPGGGILGGGRPTAIRMFDDLGLDFTQFEATASPTV